MGMSEESVFALCDQVREAAFRFTNTSDMATSKRFMRTVCYIDSKSWDCELQHNFR